MTKVFFLKNRWYMLSFVLLIILQTGVLSLYNVNVEPILYLAALECFFSLVFIIISYITFLRKYKILLQMENRIAESIDRLPDFGPPMEKELRKLLLEYDTEYRRRMSDILIEKQDMADYYVLWTHQIKTPITSIRLLIQSSDHPQNAELEAEMFKIEQYVQMAMNYVKMNEMHNDLLLRTCNVDDCVKSALKKFAREFIRRKLTVTYEELNWSIVTDEKWLIFVIEQLLSNALKYTKAGGVTIKREGEELIISDTGIGIRKEDLPRIFEKGFTGYNGRADRKSTGIGLYLCKRVMENLSFGIRARSEVGEGTQMYLDLSYKNVRGL